MATFAHIKDMKQDSLLVKSADVLHNLTDLNDDIAKTGEAVFSKFNSSKEDAVTRYKKLIPEIGKAWSENPLLDDLNLSLDIFLSQIKEGVSDE